MGALAAYATGITRYGIGARAGSMAFQSLTIGQLLHALSCRSESTSWFQRKRLQPNPYINTAVGGSLALQLLTMAWPPLRGLLGLAPLSGADLGVVAASGVLPFLANELQKTGK
jgi:Ca2+-transporting ATPase